MAYSYLTPNTGIILALISVLSACSHSKIEQAKISNSLFTISSCRAADPDVQIRARDFSRPFWTRGNADRQVHLTDEGSFIVENLRSDCYFLIESNLAQPLVIATEAQQKKTWNLRRIRDEALWELENRFRLKCSSSSKYTDERRQIMEAELAIPYDPMAPVVMPILPCDQIFGELRLDLPFSTFEGGPVVGGVWIVDDLSSGWVLSN